MNLKVAAATVNQTPLDWEGNRERLEAVLRAAREEGVDILCCPELCLSGYGCEDAFHSPDTASAAWAQLKQLLPEARDLAVSLGLPIWHEGAVYDAVVLVVDQKPIGIVAKQHLAGDGIGYEPRWFKPWPSGYQTEWLTPEGETLPLGDLVFEFRQGEQRFRVGLEIGEDAWAAQRSRGRFAALTVDVILNPSASHFTFGKQKIRERVVSESSRAFSVAYVYANLTGNEAGRVIYDGGALIASAGELVKRGPRFSLRDWGLTSAVVDIGRNRVIKAQRTEPHPQQQNSKPVTVDHGFRRHLFVTHPYDDRADWERSQTHKEEEFSRALSLGLLDYMRKSRSKGFVISLSGGADSAACAVLVHLMVQRLMLELTPQEWMAKLPYWSTMRTKSEPILTTVYQATKNSGEITRKAAKLIAQAVGANHVEYDVEELVAGYTKRIEQALGRSLGWDTDDLALQNIQARVRAPGPWMLANVLGALFLSTSNRSEAAVGYATMDGDTAGGLAPIAGIDKPFLRQWLRWMETSGPQDLAPMAELEVINIQAPTAELRPREASQTDEEDLMPYPVLQRIERLAVRDKAGPVSIFLSLEADFPESTTEQRLNWVERFFRLFTRNQWKRERYAPSFHLDEYGLDPKSWCRFPILSGGYELELTKLRRSIE